jgi:phosphate:Na+ symporter
MDLMSEALKALTGSRLKVLLGKATGNRLLGCLTGCGVTAIIQSSSVTTVLCIGFVSAGLMRLAQAIPVVMGADIGTTITAQIIAFKITHYALGLIAIGFLLRMFRRRLALARYGAMIMGLGVVFFGMALMSEAMAPLRSHQGFLELMAGMRNPLLGLLLGTAFTALVQSSSATLGIIIALAAQGLLPLEAGISLTLGANLGTTVTALLAVIGKTKPALRVALAHVIVKVLVIGVWVPLVPVLTHIAVAISPDAAHLEDPLDRLAAEVPRQIANIHTFINVVGIAALLPLVGPLTRLVTWLSGPDADPQAQLVRHLESSLLAQPAVALHAARREFALVGERVSAQMAAATRAIIDGDAASAAALPRLSSDADSHAVAVMDWLGKVAAEDLTTEQATEAQDLLEAGHHLSAIAQIGAMNLQALVEARRQDSVQISEETRQILEEFQATVASTLADAIAACTDNDRAAAERAMASKPDLRAEHARLVEHEAARLIADEPDRLATYRLERDFIEHQRRIASLARRLARRGARG